MAEPNLADLLRPESFENWLDTHITHGFDQVVMTRNGLTLFSYLCTCHAMFFRTASADDDSE